MAGKFGVILPAAGMSRRFSQNQRKKTFLDLQGRAVWLRAVEHFVNRDDVGQTIVVISPEDREFFTLKYQANLAFLNVEVIDGGAERADSVFNGLKRIRSDIEYVAVHDAARPLLAKQWIDQVFQAAETHGAAILAIPVTSTLKKAGAREQIEATVSREHLWQAQTPQVFRTSLLREAYAQRGDFQPTDEAQLVERIKHPVHLVTGSPMNLKITTQDDFRIAEALLPHLPKEKSLRSLHPFADDPPAGLF